MEGVPYAAIHELAAQHNVDLIVLNVRSKGLLEGYRGHPAADIDAIREVLLGVSRMVEEIPEIRELDLNPIFAYLRVRDALWWMPNPRNVVAELSPAFTLLLRRPPNT